MKKAIRTQIYVMVAIIAIAIALPVGLFALGGSEGEPGQPQVGSVPSTEVPVEPAASSGVTVESTTGTEEVLPVVEPTAVEGGAPIPGTVEIEAAEGGEEISDPACPPVQHNVGVVEGIVTDECGAFVNGVLFKLYKVETSGARTYIGEKFSGPGGYFGSYPAGNVCWSGLPTVDGANPQTVYELVMFADSPYYATSATAQSGYVSSNNIFGVYTCYWRQFNYTVGTHKMGLIEGHKFADMNLNGIMDPGEPGIAGVTINLDDDAQSTVSGADGYFSFEVEEGAHLVSEDLTTAPGYFPTTSTLASVNVTSCGPPAVVNFGNAPYGSISGTKYIDTDRDGIHDPDEVVLAGVTIRLFGNIGPAAPPVVLETVTDENGNYSFANLKPGLYKVTEAVPEGMDAILPDRIIGWNVLLVPGQAASGLNFFNAYKPLGSISGTKYRDPDKSGTLNGDETTIGGVTIKLTGTTDKGASVSLETTTDVNGEYSFSDLQPGDYNVKEVVPDGMEAVAPLADTGTDVTVGSGQPVVGIDFFNADETLPALIEGYVFIDMDEDGIMDSGETGIAGVTVNLSGDATATTTTAGATGYYSFTVAPGDYTVSTPALAPPDEEVVAGYYPTTNISFPVTVAAGETARRDFGHAPYGSISGAKHNDANTNAILDEGEAPVAGMTVNLTGTTNGGESITLSTTTDTDGIYSFSGLKAGLYKVAEEVPVNMSAMTDEEIDVTLTVGENLGDVNFLNASFGTPNPDPDPDPDEDEDYGQTTPTTDTTVGLPTTTATALPYTGMNQAPVTLTALAIVLFGFMLLTLGLRSWRKELGGTGPSSPVPPVRYWD